MLISSPDTSYTVWPSWANSFAYRWEDLPEIFAHPWESGHFGSGFNERMAIEKGFLTADCDGYSLISGPCGNGIIVREGARFRDGVKMPGWLGHAILATGADFTTTPGVVNLIANPPIRVSYLELRDDAGLRLMGEGKKKPREYPCDATIEHAEAALDKCYWLVTLKSGRSQVKGLEDLPIWAKGFGLTLTPIDSVSEPLEQEVAPWFINPEIVRCWYEVSGSKPDAGLQLAMMIYTAFQFRQVGGSRVRGLHLIANVDSKPNSRKHWNPVYK